MNDIIPVSVPVIGTQKDQWGDIRGFVGRIEAELPVLPSPERPTGDLDALFEYLHDGDAWSGWSVRKKPVDVASLSLDIEDRRALLLNPFCSLAPTSPAAPTYSPVDGDPSEHPALQEMAEKARSLLGDMAVVDGQIVLRNDGPLLFVTRIQDKRIGYRFLEAERMDSWDRRFGTTFSAFDYAAIKGLLHSYNAIEVTGARPKTIPDGWDRAKARGRIAKRALEEIGKRLDIRLSAHSLSALGGRTIAALDSFRNESGSERLLDAVSTMMANPCHGFDGRSLLPYVIDFVEEHARLLDLETTVIAEELNGFKI